MFRAELRTESQRYSKCSDLPKETSRMETAHLQRAPLASKNSSIPRPSKLPQPAAMATKSRKRLAETSAVEEKENAPKRLKLDKTSVQENRPISKPTAVAKKTAGKTATKVNFKPAAKSTTAAVARKPATRPPTSSRGSGSVAGTGGKTTGGATAGAGGNGKQKRAAWDLKGRLQDMEVLVSDERKNSQTIQSQIGDLVERLEDLEHIRSLQEGTIKMQQEAGTAASSQITELQSELSETKQKLLETMRNHTHEVEMLQLSKSSLQRSHDQLESELTAARAEVTSLKGTVSQMAADSSAIQCQLEATKVARDQAIAESQNKSQVIASLQQQLEEHLSTISECKSRIREEETTRRRLHNTIQELKGNIRVFCRVRPLLPCEGTSSLDESSSSSRDSSGSRDGAAAKQMHLKLDYPDISREQKKVVLQFSQGESGSSKGYDFEFDKVFNYGSTQGAVFNEISQLVQSALDGYNVCIFAYGQTGSGKTFTMEGPDRGDHEMRGMIPRAVEQVFSAASSLTEKGWQYTMEASFLEIYNETIRDLLASGNSDAKLEIKIDPNNAADVYVTNLTPVMVTSQTQVGRLLERAAKNRAVAATLCNERSSRSHSVFRLKLTGTNEKTGEACQGTLNLIDLAGSERLSSSGSAGERLKETKNINKSLSNLGNVIMALSNKEQHIPYRNSKLTYLLQNSLGGNSKTLMFVNISPEPAAFQETLCSLRFATKVNQCNIGTASKKVIKN